MVQLFDRVFETYFFLGSCCFVSDNFFNKVEDLLF